MDRWIHIHAGEAAAREEAEVARAEAEACRIEVINEYIDRQIE